MLLLHFNNKKNFHKCACEKDYKRRGNGPVKPDSNKACGRSGEKEVNYEFNSGFSF
jgi:hypothetical protein